jgi:hypothetical protein
MPCTPLDVLAIVNEVNAGTYSETNDINADGMVSPLDALLAINEANKRSMASENPAVLHPSPGGASGIAFSPCGNDYAMTLLAVSDATPVLRVGGDEFIPVVTREFGNFNAWDFTVAGRGYEMLRIEGEFPSDELLMLIVG